MNNKNNIENKLNNIKNNIEEKYSNRIKNIKFYYYNENNQQYLSLFIDIIDINLEIDLYFILRLTEKYFDIKELYVMNYDCITDEKGEYTGEMFIKLVYDSEIKN